MNIFSSGWLQRMADKSGKTPTSRIESVFHILHDWVDVPGMRQQLCDALLDNDSLHLLKSHLALLVHASGASNPEMVADQVYMILLGALNEEVRHSSSRSLIQASQAALILVTAQIPVRHSHRSKYAVAASIMIMAGSLTWIFTHQHPPEIVAAQPARIVALVSVPTNPDRVSALYHLHEKISTADCSYPQALMLAPEQRAPFIENVVDGDIGDVPPESMVMVSQLYQKVDCYYPPAAMLL